MFAFAILCFSFLLSLVSAGPLTMRDVFSPHITSPNEHTVWPVGTKQTVTWETANIPPDSQLTNPNGKVVLGHLGPTGGLNLQLDNPLAQNFKLRVGQIDITVPSVPPRDDYIIVLFGDSGNASPAFAITRITNGSNSSSSSLPLSSTPVPSSQVIIATSSSLISTPIPITGTVITGGSSEGTPSSSAVTPSQPSSASSVITTLPPTSSVTSPTPVSQSTGTSSVPAPTNTSAANASHHLGLIKMTSFIGLVSLALAFVI